MLPAYLPRPGTKTRQAAAQPGEGYPLRRATPIRFIAGDFSRQRVVFRLCPKDTDDGVSLR